MTDRRSLVSDQGALLRRAQQGHQAGIWTALPGYVTKFNAAAMTCEVQPTIMMQLTDPLGAKTWVKLPLLLDCPVVFPSGGGFTLTFPIAAGDECLVVFASRCIDSWWQSGGVQVQAEFRMHDLSDGFVLPGPHSQPHVVPAISTSSVQLRNNVGTLFVEVTNSIINLNGPVHITGAVTTDSTIAAAGEITAVGTNLHRHEHGGVSTGGSFTALPTNV